MEVRGPVINAHVHAYGSDVGAVVGKPVVGIFGALGLLQLYVGRLEFDQALGLVCPNESSLNSFKKGNLARRAAKSLLDTE